MPGGEPIQLGPFVGGLNNLSHAAMIEDNECQDLVNFEVDIDGSLRSRPPIQEQVAPTGPATRCKVIGSGNLGSNITGYAFASHSSGIYRWDNSTWSKITSEPTSSYFMLQYSKSGTDWAYFFAVGPTGIELGGRWNPDSGWVPVAGLPKCRVGCIYKDRFWVSPGIVGPGANPSRLTFSDPGDGDTWPATNFIDVNPGDGQAITNLLTVDDNLIIFKERSIYVLGYDVNPADAILRQLESSIGAPWYYCALEKDGVVYFYDEQDVYEMRDFQFRKLTERIKFSRGTPAATILDDHFMFDLEDRILVQYGVSMYAFNILSQTWSRFESSNSDLNSIGICYPFYRTWTSADYSNRVLYYLGGSMDSTIAKMFRWYPEVDSVKEQHGLGGGVTLDKITAYMQTKDFTFDTKSFFKRLFWWGAEVFGKGSDPSYDHYGEVRWFGGSATNSQRTDFDLGDSSGLKFIKLKKSLRFRRVNFKISLQTEGDNYVRLFFIIPTLTVPKETVVESTTT